MQGATRTHSAHLHSLVHEKVGGRNGPVCSSHGPSWRSCCLDLATIINCRILEVLNAAHFGQKLDHTFSSVVMLLKDYETLFFVPNYRSLIHLSTIVAAEIFHLEVASRGQVID